MSSRQGGRIRGVIGRGWEAVHEGGHPVVGEPRRQPHREVAPRLENDSNNNCYYYGKKMVRTTPGPWVESIWGDQVLVCGLTLMEGKLTAEGHERIAESLEESVKLREEKESDSEDAEQDSEEDEV